MGFRYSRFAGEPPTHEEFRAKPGTYRLGQAVTIANGILTPITGAVTTTPPYITMFEGVIPASPTEGANWLSGKGDRVPVARVDASIFAAPLSADTATLAVGDLLQVAADGQSVNKTAAGAFEVVGFDGTKKGDIVYGRFTAVAKKV